VNECRPGRPVLTILVAALDRLVNSPPQRLAKRPLLPRRERLPPTHALALSEAGQPIVYGSPDLQNGRRVQRWS
jgi:hypothetical protein